MKSIVLDLDGTLLRTDKSISDRTLRVLKKCKKAGLEIVIATARPLRSVFMLLPEEFHGEAMICYNGAEIYENGQKVYENLLSVNDLHQIVNWLESHWPDCTISVEIDNVLYSNKKLEGPWMHQVVALKDVIGRPAAKILVHGFKRKRMCEFNDFIPEACRVVLTDQGTLGHISSSSVSKLAALQELIKKRGLSLKDVIAFGDDMNDIELIKGSGTGVAMENAVDELKGVADIITASNDCDGVAAILELEVEKLNDKETPAE